MEIFTDLFKHLATTLAPIEFMFLVIATMLVFTGMLKVVLRVGTKKGGLMGLIKGEPTATLETIDKKLDTVATIAGVETALNGVTAFIAGIDRDSTVRHNVLQAQISQILAIRSDIQKFEETAKRELNVIQSSFAVHSAHDHQAFDNIFDFLRRNQESIQRISLQLEKMDDFSKGWAPEIRDYHKALTKEIGELSRDISLMDRTLQAQINNAQSVKLR